MSTTVRPEMDDRATFRKLSPQLPAEAVTMSTTRVTTSGLLSNRTWPSPVVACRTDSGQAAATVGTSTRSTTRARATI